MDPQRLSCCFPITDEQKEERINAFIDSIDPDAVCSLASRHHGSKPCRLFQKAANGSYNVCYFVEFPDDGTRWVVRIPLVPTVRNVWDKVQCEVATMRYIEKNTSIPIPSVHGFGPAGPVNDHNPTGLAYVILDYVPGRSLDLASFFLNESRQSRSRFYSQLIDVLAELRCQEFDQAGSLMLDVDGGSAYPLGPSLSLQLNDLDVDQGVQSISKGPFSSSSDFASHCFQILEEKYRSPVSDMSLFTAQLEVFALHDMKERIPALTAGPDDGGPFVLAHPDLRWSNIIVDEDLTIQGIIDWEWASTVPRQFFMPPTWIAGRPPEWITGVHYRIEFGWFRDVLVAKAETSRPCRQLAQEWGPRLPKQVAFPLAVLLRHHSHFLALYYKAIFPHFYKRPLEETLAQFFAADGDNGPFSLDVQQRLANSRRYTQYLQVNGWYTPLEPAQSTGKAIREEHTATGIQHPAEDIKHPSHSLPGPVSPC